MITALLLLLASSDGVLKLLEQEADVTVLKPGLTRLPLPQEVLTASKQDLGDVRLYDGEKEIPYVVDSGEGSVTREERIPLKVGAAKREEQRRDTGPTIYRENYELAAMQAGGLFMLQIDSPLSRFVRRITINDAEGVSIFRLPQMNASRTSIPLKIEPGRPYFIKVEGEGDGYLEPRFTLVRDTYFSLGAKDLELAFEDAKISERDENTVITFERPAGLVPSSVVLTTSSEFFDRTVRVYDESLAYGERLIGMSRIFRMTGLVPAEETAIAIGGARGERLRIEISDGESPGLIGIALRGIVRQPTLVFSAPGRPVVLRFGGGRATRPRYDISGLIPPIGSTSVGKRGEALERLFTPGALATATLSPVRKNPAFDSQPALAFAMHAGAAIDVRKFTHRKGLTIEASREGLSRITLGPEEQAVMREDLGDVRLVDKLGKQWPYLLDARAQELWRPLLFEGPETADKKSRFRLKDEIAPMSIDAVELSVGQGFVDRAYRLFAVDADGKEKEILAGRLQKPADSKRPITLVLTPVRAQSFVLEVVDRDDAPLDLTAGRGRYVQAHVYAAAAPGPYFLFLGARSEERPSYDLERARETVLAVRANDAFVESLARNPDYTIASKLDDRATTMEIALWAAIILAVLVLGALTLRLSKQES